MSTNVWTVKPTPESYDDWDPPQCTALTVKHRLCRNAVTGGQVFSAGGTHFCGTDQKARQIQQLRCAVHVQ